MKILITGGDSRLARAFVAGLPAGYAARLVDADFAAPPPASAESMRGDLRNPAFAQAAVAGMSAVVHLAPLAPPGADDLAALDQATRGTFVLMSAALDAGIQRIVLGSSLALFDALPTAWNINEHWRPQPQPTIEHLCPWLAELSTRHCTWATGAPVVCLRFGRLVDSDEAQRLPYDPRWLHIEDAVQGLQRALAYEPRFWSVFHITAAGEQGRVRLGLAGRPAFGYQPRYSFPGGGAGRDAGSPRGGVGGDAGLPGSLARPIHKVVIFGAGGPIGGAVARELAGAYIVRMSDVRPIADIIADGPRRDQNATAPLPTLLPPPHEEIVADVTDPAAVMAACADMDAVINCTVIRRDPVLAFHVNTLGVYNIVRACVAHGIRRFVQTGPQLHTLIKQDDYSGDYDIPDDAPPRPGRQLYPHSKYLGQEIARVFALAYGMEIPVLLFDGFWGPETTLAGPNFPLVISWQDSARAIRRALEAASLPSPYEVFTINADLPHGVFPNSKAKRLLGWQPRDDLRRLWQLE